MTVNRSFRINIGNTYPSNMHETAVNMIAKLEGTQFKVSNNGLARGATQHGTVKLVHPSIRSRPPYFFDVTINFFDETTEETPQTATDENGDPVIPTGGQNVKHRPLASYPTNGQLTAKGQAL